MRFYDEVKERWQKSSWISLAAEFCQENTHRCLGLDVTHPLVHFFAATAITSQKN